jgi:hypothetical protein
VPANGLSLSIFVGREIDFGGLLYRAFEFIDPLLLITRDNLERREIAIDVDSQSGPLLLFDICRDLGSVIGKVSDVTIGS